ncbi:CG10702 [Drosophila busckii]|uniref:CG10702 n=1 Tax=Drosophila busckii TaxID=30019 RepID=A0A0M3QT88_DROBS|nr:CG10702 [Drosophila busckii]
MVIALPNTYPHQQKNRSECSSIDVRNDCNNLHLLDNCTVVMGFVMITLITNGLKCNYSMYTFPKLREITDFMIFNDVRGLVNIKNMFPNLTVIKGKRLFLNYALGITNMPTLELLEFNSLVAIQRGHVYIGRCSKLCQLEGINWDRLTLSTGENHIIKSPLSNCTQRASCKGCASNYCWSNFTCQRFENDNVAHYDRGYQPNNASECVRCSAHEACVSVCNPEQAEGVFIIYNLADADELRGCQILNSSLIITIRSQVNEEQLEKSMSSIREIRGYLKVYRSSQLLSLKFLSNLRFIYGDPLESDHYAIILYDNKQLADLWRPTVQLHLTRGGMFMHRNNKLCNKHIQDFTSLVVHDLDMDSLQTSDQEVLCGPAKLQMQALARSHKRILLSWPKAQTSQSVEILYRPLAAGQLETEHSELEAPICTRINWQRELLFADELTGNDTHYSYTLEQLQPDTRYSCLVRTFGGSVQQEARSELLYVQTLLDIPKEPLLSMSKKTDNGFTLRISAQEQDYFVLSVYEMPDDLKYVDERNYCKQPVLIWQNMDDWPSYQEFDYDSCCAHHVELFEEQHFKDEIHAMYRCSLDAPSNCVPLPAQPTLQYNLTGNTTLHELRSLQRYREYSLQLQACNAIGCSSAVILNERTNYTIGADLMQLRACQLGDRKKYIVRFEEPKQPNGLIVSYMLHYRMNISEQVQLSELSCVTRREHALNNYVHVDNLNYTYNESAVRVHSLAGSGLTDFIPITACDSDMQLPIELDQHLHIGTVTDETPESEHSHGHGFSIFVFGFFFGCTISLVWLLYKRRCWRKWQVLRRYMPVREQWLREHSDDREILVDGFETVRFQNNNPNNNSNSSNIE